MNQQNLTVEHLPWLDGIRGIASFWVLSSHIQILSGLSAFPILSWGSLAVDLFMMLSGFLMTHHYIIRRRIEPWDSSRTHLAFWVRRFFRIAPLYYILLAVAFFLGPWLGEYRSSIANAWPNTPTPLERYRDQSILNISTHLSFVFGILPDYAFRTPLPDWSIGLEMQFYLVFPFILLTISHIGSIKAGLIILFVSLLSQEVFPSYFSRFEMPSFLPIKIYVFMVGIWIATARQQKSMLTGLVFSLLVCGFWIYFEKTIISVARLCLVLIMYYLMNNGSLPGSHILEGSIDKIRKGLSCGIARFLGDTSYAVYLLHLLIVLPVVGELIEFPFYLDLKASYRFGVCLLLSVPITYLIAWALFQSVERKGIQLGKFVLQTFNKNAQNHVSFFQTIRAWLYER